MPLERALLRHPTTGGRQWLSFSDPVDAWETDDLAEVADVLRAAEAANRAGRWVVGMVSYDAAPAFDTALVALRDEDVPLASFAAFDTATPAQAPAGDDYEIGTWRPSRWRSGYEADVRQVKELIAAGETYQVNYTMRLSSSFLGDPMGFFAAMVRAQRADHLAYLDFGDRVACSASPELFIRREGRTLQSRPMKGTRPRSADPEADTALAAELVASEKDRSENTMIVDMVRNDLGRVGDVGSLRTTALHTVESYPTVHQLTSTVEVETDADLVEIFNATFPGASITGAPKVNTSGFIAELEGVPRGIYTGSIGALAPGGDFEFNIAIRTAWINRVTGRATYGVGGGVVWDSDPSAEWREAHDKARIVYRADRPFRLLESIAIDPDRGVVLIDEHMDRLADAATYFGYELDRETVRLRLEELIGHTPIVARVLVGPNGAVEIETRDIPAIGDQVTVVLDDRPINKNDEFLRHKTTRRQRYEEAKARFPEAYDVLLWNRRGELTESTVANLVIELDGELLTPATSAGLLPGTLRAAELEDGTIREATLTVAELRRASRVWLINSVRGWVEVDVDLATVPSYLATVEAGQPTLDG